MTEKGFTTTGTEEYFAEREGKINARLTEAKSKIDEIETRVRKEIDEITVRRDRIHHHLKFETGAQRDIQSGKGRFDLIPPLPVRRLAQIYEAGAIKAVARAGGLALLLVEFRCVAHLRFAIPWLQVPWKVKRTAESVSWGVVGAWSVKSADGQCYLSPFHPSGPRSSAHLDRQRVFHRE